MSDSEYSYSLEEALAGRADDDRKRAKENRLWGPPPSVESLLDAEDYAVMAMEDAPPPLTSRARRALVAAAPETE